MVFALLWSSLLWPAMVFTLPALWSSAMLFRFSPAQIVRATVFRLLQIVI